MNGDDGVTIPYLHSVLGDDRLSPLVADPILCERIKIESVYAEAVESQEEEAHQIRSEEALLIPDDIDYSEYVKFLVYLGNDNYLLFYTFQSQPVFV